MRKTVECVAAFLAVAVLVACFPGQAQDFTDIGKRRPFLLSGSVGAQASTRLSPQGPYSDPFSYVLNVQLTPSLYGFSMPVSLSYADSKLSYSQPFSRYSLQPTYKWITAYLGRTTLNMHPYGLSDHQFDGAGISLQPKKFPLKFMAMYGRFAKAVADTSARAGANSFQSLSSYKRTGYAFKLDFEHKNQKVGVHFFSARDKAGTLPDWAAAGVQPAANAVLALDFSFQMWKDFNLFGQAALSSYINNTDEQPVRSGLLRSSSNLSVAMKAGASYKWLSLSYERIAPNYKSMGSYYFNTDYENLVLDFSHTFSFMDVRAELGWQHDDLSGNKAERMDRVVGSAYANFRIGKCFSTNLSYSNFTSYTQTKPMDLTAPDDPLIQDFDTVPYRQIAQQAQWAFQFRTPKTAKYRQEAGIDVSYQSSRMSLQHSFSDYVSGNLRHCIVFDGDWRLQSAVSVSTCISRDRREEGAHQEIRYGIGPSVALTKPFLEKTLQASVSGSYYLDMSGKQVQGGVWGMRCGLSYTLRKAHNFDLNLSTRLSTTNMNFEFQGQISYRYTFSLDPFKNAKKKAGSRKKPAEV